MDGIIGCNATQLLPSNATRSTGPALGDPICLCVGSFVRCKVVRMHHPMCTDALSTRRLRVTRRTNAGLHFFSAQKLRCQAVRPTAGDMKGQPQPQRQPASGLNTAEGGASRRAALLALTAGLTGWATGLGLGADQLRAWAAEGITTVFVAGATGNTGRRVVQQLRQAGFSVRAGVRDTSKALALGFGADPRVTIVEADVTKGVDVLIDAIGGAQAVVCATGAAGFGPNGSAQVDEQGTIKLVDAALRVSGGDGGGVRKFVLVSSLLTNAAAVGQGTNPNYLFLNLFDRVLDRKLKAEKYLRASGLNYTIIRPGGLSNEPESVVGNLILSGEDTLFALERDPGRAISRDTVAAVAVQAVLQPEASKDKVVEVVASPTATRLDPELWFKGV